MVKKLDSQERAITTEELRKLVDINRLKMSSLNEPQRDLCPSGNSEDRKKVMGRMADRNIGERLRRRRICESIASKSTETEEEHPCSIPSCSASSPSSPFSVSFSPSTSFSFEASSETPPPSPYRGRIGARVEKEIDLSVEKKKLKELRKGGYLMEEEYKQRLDNLNGKRN
jgi:hypothetical protein